MKRLRVTFVLAAVGLLLANSSALAARGPGPGAGPGPGGGGGGGTGATYDAFFTSSHFSGSGNCARCHNGLTDAAGEDVSIETDWSSTLMANSTRDPLWRAKVRAELLRNPSLAPLIASKCTRCHAPMAHTEATVAGEAISVFEGGFLAPDNPHYDQAMDGVSCTLCHQIADSPRLGTLAGFSGGYEIDSFPLAVDRRIYGPFADVLTQPMRNQVEYTPLLGSHLGESKICGTCHNLKTPYVDENGQVLSTTPAEEFPEQMVFSEWAHSAYAGQRACRDCHLPSTDGVVISSMPMWLNTARDGFGIHELAGGNRLMLDILATNGAALGTTSDNFAETQAATSLLLESAAAIERVQSSLSAGRLDFRLRITSLTGHKLPSGIPLRRAVLHVTVQDSRGRIVFESGRVQADGSIVGVDADADGTTFEPHHELITSPAQVQVYETIMENNLGQVTYTLLRAMRYAKDNRLLPAGFDKGSADEDIQVVGAAESDPDFVGGSDEIAFRIDGLSGKKYTVTAELIYQTISYAAVQDLISEASAESTTFKSMYDASARKSTVMTSRQFVVSR